MNYAIYCSLGVPVSATDRQVIRATRDLFKPSSQGRERREARHGLYRDMLREHREARQLVVDNRF